MSQGITIDVNALSDSIRQKTKDIVIKSKNLINKVHRAIKAHVIATEATNTEITAQIQKLRERKFDKLTELRQKRQSVLKYFKDSIAEIRSQRSEVYKKALEAARTELGLTTPEIAEPEPEVPAADSV